MSCPKCEVTMHQFEGKWVCPRTLILKHWKPLCDQEPTRIKATDAEQKLMDGIMRAIKRCNEKMRPGSNACECAEFIYTKIAEAAETGEMPT